MKASFRTYRTSSRSGVNRIWRGVPFEDRLRQSRKAVPMSKTIEADAKITYEVRAIERYEVVRMETSERCGSISTCGQFTSKEDAERVAGLLRHSDLPKSDPK